MQCPNCGTDLKPGTKFCFNCGYYLEEESDDNHFDTSEKSQDDTDEILNESDNKEPKFSTNNIDFGTDDFNNKNKDKKKFDVKANLTYIILGGVLFFSLILLLYGVISKNNNKNVTPDTPIQKTEKVVSIDNYKVTVPAGLDYQIQNKCIFISDDEKYSFSFTLKDGNYDNYSNNLEAYADELKKLGYEVGNYEKKRINASELLIYTLSGDSDVKYLYLTKYDSKLVAMGVINVHNSSKIDDVYKVVIKIVSSVKFSEDSDEKKDESDTENDVSSSIVQGISGLIN